MSVRFIEAVPCQYSFVCNFSGGLAAVKVRKGTDEKWGFIDKTGKEVVPAIYDKMKNLSNGMAIVGKYEKNKYHGGYGVGFHEEACTTWGYIDVTGKEIIPRMYNVFRDFSDGMAVVGIGDWRGDMKVVYGEVHVSYNFYGKYGYVNDAGNEVIPCKFDYADNFFDGIAMVMVNDRFFLIDKMGNEIMDNETMLRSRMSSLSHVSPKGIRYISDGLLAVSNTQRDFDYERPQITKWGFKDKSGKIAVPFIYDEVQDFSEGLAAVKMGEHSCAKWGYIDTAGNEVIPLKYRFEPGRFSEGLASVRDDEGQFFIDTSGRKVFSHRYNKTKCFSEGFVAVLKFSFEKNEQGFSVVKDEFWGFIDRKGNEVVPCIYKDVRSFSEGMAAVARGEKFRLEWGFVSVC